MFARTVVAPFAMSQIAFAAPGANEGGQPPAVADPSGDSVVVEDGSSAASLIAAGSSPRVHPFFFESLDRRFTVDTVPAGFMALRADVRNIWATVPNPSYWSVDNYHVPAEGPVKRLDPFERWETGDYKKLHDMLKLLVDSRLTGGKKPEDVNVLVARPGCNNWHAIKILLDMGVTVLWVDDRKRVIDTMFSDLESLLQNRGTDDMHSKEYYQGVYDSLTLEYLVTSGIDEVIDDGWQFDIALYTFPYDLTSKITDHMKDDSIIVWQGNRPVVARNAMFSGYGALQDYGWQTLLHVDLDEQRAYLLPSNLVGMGDSFLRIFKRIGGADDTLSRKLGELLVPLGNTAWTEINMGAEAMTLEAMEGTGFTAKVVFNDYWGHDQLTDVWVYMSEVREQIRDMVMVAVRNGATKVDVSLDVAKHAIVVKGTFADRTVEGFISLVSRASYQS